MERLYFNPPVLAIVTGTSGSGKTTLSSGLYDGNGNRISPGVMHTIHAIYINKDMISDGFSKERSGEFYEQVVRRGTYNAIDNIARCNLMLGNSIWIDANYSTEVQNEGWASRYRILAEETNSMLKLLRCVAPEDIIKRRLEERSYERDRGKLEDWTGFLKREPIHVPVPFNGIEIDTSNSLEECVKRALKFLQE
ncbi:MAG: AAA family ATPase [Nanoarchaeota archaeon]